MKAGFMKAHETIRLNLAATLLSGLLCSLLLVFCQQAPGEKAEVLASYAIFLPILLSVFAALFQYNFVMKPWHKALGELLRKSLSLEESSSGAHLMAGPKKSQAIEQETASNLRRGDIQLSRLSKSIEIATERMKETQLRQNALIQHAVDVICVIDLKSTILSVNPAARFVWGYEPDELVGRQITDFLVSDDVNNTMKAILRAEKSIDKIYFENRFAKKSGEIVDLLWSAHLSATDRGLFCIAHDITERKLAERLLKESEERVRIILESLPAGVAVINQKGKLEFMNKTAMELTGLSEASATHASDLFSFADKNDEHFALKEGLNDPFDCTITRASGERFSAEASARELSWQGGKACLLIFLDATLKHELEKAKREFVAMVSHDLRTPLTAISLIFAYLIDGLGGELSEDGMDFANRGQESCQRLMNLVQDLLDLEKMRAGKFVMEKVETLVPEIIDAAVAAVTPYADSQEIKLAINCPDGLKSVCDGARIIQVLVNLLSNAIKFSYPDATVSIEVKSNPDITVAVKNRGKVIPEEKLASIFEKFEQADSSGAIERKGSGLGLTISKTIIEEHECRIWAESSEDSGTSFLFTLPGLS